MTMKPIDFAKAAGVAIAVLVVNVLIAILAVLFYSVAIEPGHPREFYDAAAQRIATWCSHIAGTALFLAAGYLFARRRPDRRGYLFALVFSMLYAIIDAATVGFVGTVSVEFGLSMLAKLAAALAGAYAASRATQTSVIERIERGKLWLNPLTGSSVIGPVPVPTQVTALCKPGWDIAGVVAKVGKGWRLVEVWNVSP